MQCKIIETSQIMIMIDVNEITLFHTVLSELKSNVGGFTIFCHHQHPLMSDRCLGLSKHMQDNQSINQSKRHYLIEPPHS